MGFKRAVEVIQHDAGLDYAAPVFDIQIYDCVQIFRAIDDE
jgi:hypothetical protein